MSFDISFLVSMEAPIPDTITLQQWLQKLPHLDSVEPGEGVLWRYDYLNPETGVSFALMYRQPESSPIRNRAWDTGLTASVPTLCPTFVARESMMVIAQLAKQTSMWVYLPSGDMLKTCEASQLQTLWSDINQKTLTRFSADSKNAPRYFPQEQLDEMWHYLNARQALLKRYSAKNVYVPKVILVRNKLDKRQIFRAAMWSEVNPTVIPTVDAYVITRPKTLLFGLIPGASTITVVVRSEVLQDIIEPCLREATTPIPHRLLEDTSGIKMKIFRRLRDSLQLRFQDFETLTVDEVVDVKV